MNIFNSSCGFLQHHCRPTKDDRHWSLCPTSSSHRTDQQLIRTHAARKARGHMRYFVLATMSRGTQWGSADWRQRKAQWLRRWLRFSLSNSTADSSRQTWPNWHFTTRQHENPTQTAPNSAQHIFMKKQLSLIITVSLTFFSFLIVWPHSEGGIKEICYILLSLGHDNLGSIAKKNLSHSNRFIYIQTSKKWKKKSY